MNNRSLKKMLNEQDLIVGLCVDHICTAWLAKIYADAGSDFIYIENEHVFFNEEKLGNFIMDCRLCGLPVVAKSAYLNRGSIAKLLDAGATGIQLPMTETAGQMSEVASYIKYPPDGVRAAALGLGNTEYEPVDAVEWLKKANSETVLIAHIESYTGLSNVEKILQIPQVDIMFVGMFDLTVSLGYPGKYDHPDVIKAMKRLFEVAKAYGKVSGMWAPSYEIAEYWIKQGVRYIMTGGDVEFIVKGAYDTIKCFPGHSAKILVG